MPDVLLFGATGYTGRLTARALARRGADFVIAGRDRAKLEALAAETGGPEVREARVGDVESLAKALTDVGALITCVGPFGDLGDTAVEAALAAGVHYVDSTGEGPFVAALFERDEEARRAGIVMAPAMGFDEVPADVAATLATEGMSDAELVLTYAAPLTPSGGTLGTLPNVLGAEANWLRDGRRHRVPFGSVRRWAPMPAPLGPKPSVASPMSICELAPRHLDLRSLETYVTVSTLQGAALRVLGGPMLAFLGTAPVRSSISMLGSRIDGPSDKARNKGWTLLAEARTDSEWRNVVVTGKDIYGFTAEALAAGALALARGEHDRAGVLAPVPAIGLETLTEELKSLGVGIEVHG